MKLKDMRIIVTGAARGMGRHFALRLAEHGARVLGTDIAEDGLVSLKEDAQELPGMIETFTGDVSSEDDVSRMVDCAVQAFDAPNGLINNAGLFRDGLLVRKDRKTGEVRTMSLADWQRVIAVDLTGPFLCARAVAARMIEMGARPGVIINISSASRHGNMGQSNYSAAKAGLVADTKLWAEELARYGIRVGAIAPGFVKTPLLEGMRPEILEKMRKKIPLARLALPEEIFTGIKFIIECNYFTGRCLDIDGGLTL